MPKGHYLINGKWVRNPGKRQRSSRKDPLIKRLLVNEFENKKELMGEQLKEVLNLSGANLQKDKPLLIFDSPNDFYDDEIRQIFAEMIPVKSKLSPIKDDPLSLTDGSYRRFCDYHLFEKLDGTEIDCVDCQLKNNKVKRDVVRQEIMQLEIDLQHLENKAKKKLNM